MKIKEYLDDRESEFVNSGSQLKAFDSATSKFTEVQKSSDRDSIQPFDLKSLSPSKILETFNEECDKKQEQQRKQKEQLEL
jgi:hypothetical protein